MAKLEPVCPEPKVFVGQLPDEASTQDIRTLFESYGPLADCNVIKGPDGRGRGFAMVQFSKWRDAEAAVENLNGTSSLGGNRTLVVKIADPPKRGGASVGGIAPKKLFVGQVPTDTDEQQLRSLFEPYGTIKDMHLVRKSHPWFAFVTFDRWAEAEAAIEALDGQTVLPNARTALVVKFADAKPSEGIKTGEKRALGADSGMPQKRQFMGSEGGQAVMGNFGGSAMGMMGYTPMATGQMMNGGMMNRMGGLAMGNLGSMAAMGMTPATNMMMTNLGSGMGYSMAMPNNGMTIAPMGMAPSIMTASPQHNRNMGRMGNGMNNPAARQWKLFVGQVPFEATEQDLWGVFVPMGDIVELVVLRHPSTGKSRGCAFVTYSSQEAAQAAIDQIHEKVALPGRDKVLVVKYANN